MKDLGHGTYEAETPEEWEQAKAFAAERHAALEALGDLGLTDESLLVGRRG